MVYIILIFVALWVLSGVISFLQDAWEIIKIVLIIGIVIIGIVCIVQYIGLKKIGMLIGAMVGIVCALGVLIYMIHKITTDYTMKDNEKVLLRCLEQDCMKFGYMTSDMWRDKLSGLSNRKYKTSFREITAAFAEEMERKYIINTEKEDWENTIIAVLEKNRIANMSTLKMALADKLSYTHKTRDEDIIFRYMKDMNIDRIRLQEDEVRIECGLSSSDTIPQSLMYLYKLPEGELQWRYGKLALEEEEYYAVLETGLRNGRLFGDVYTN